MSILNANDHLLIVLAEYRQRAALDKGLKVRTMMKISRRKWKTSTRAYRKSVEFQERMYKVQNQ